MNNATRILKQLAGGKATREQLYKAIVVIPDPTLATKLTQLRHAGLIAGQRVPGGVACIWSITEAGRDRLRQQGIDADASLEVQSMFGSCGERIGRVPSIFHLGGLAA